MRSLYEDNLQFEYISVKIPKALPRAGSKLNYQNRGINLANMTELDTITRFHEFRLRSEF